MAKTTKKERNPLLTARQKEAKENIRIYNECKERMISEVLEMEMVDRKRRRTHVRTYPELEAKHAMPTEQRLRDLEKWQHEFEDGVQSVVNLATTVCKFAAYTVVIIFVTWYITVVIYT